MTIYTFTKKVPPRIESSIDEHLRYLTETVFKKKGTKHAPFYKHGAQHAAETAVIATLLIAFYQQHQQERMQSLPNQFKKCLQLTCLLHDIGRKSDSGPDYWDNDSATSAYSYLVAAGLPRQQATLYFAAINYKDLKETQRLNSLIIRTNNAGHACKESIPINTNITFLFARELLHNADCLQIMRVRTFFKGEQHLYRAQLYHETSPDHTLSINSNFRLFIAATRGLMYETGSHLISTYSHFAMNSKVDTNRFTTVHNIATNIPYFKALQQSENESETECKDSTPTNIPKLVNIWQGDSDRYFIRAITNPAQHCGVRPHYKTTNYGIERYKQSRQGSNYKRLCPKIKTRSHKNGARNRSVSYIKKDAIMNACITGALEIHKVHIDSQQPLAIYDHNEGTGSGKAQRIALKEMRPLDTRNAEHQLNELPHAKLDAPCGEKHNNEVVLTWLSAKTLYGLAFEDGRDTCSRRNHPFIHPPELAEAISFIRVIYMYFFNQNTDLLLFRYSATNQSLIQYDVLESTMHRDILQSWSTIIKFGIKNPAYHKNHSEARFGNALNAEDFLTLEFNFLSHFSFFTKPRQATSSELISLYPEDLKKQLLQLAYHEFVYLNAKSIAVLERYNDQASHILATLAVTEAKIRHKQCISNNERTIAWQNAFQALNPNFLCWELCWNDNENIEQFFIAHIEQIILYKRKNLINALFQNENTHPAHEFTTVQNNLANSQWERWQQRLDTSELDHIPFDLISATQIYAPHDCQLSPLPQSYFGLYNRIRNKQQYLSGTFRTTQSEYLAAKKRILKLHPDRVIQQINEHYRLSKPVFYVTWLPARALLAYPAVVGIIAIITKIITDINDEKQVPWGHVIFTIPICIALLLGLQFSNPSQHADFFLNAPSHANTQNKNRPQLSFTLFDKNRTYENIENLPDDTRNSLADIFDGAIIQRRHYYRNTNDRHSLWYHSPQKPEREVDYKHLRSQLAKPLVRLNLRHQQTLNTIKENGHQTQLTTIKIQY